MGRDDWPFFISKEKLQIACVGHQVVRKQAQGQQKIRAQVVIGCRSGVQEQKDTNDFPDSMNVVCKIPDGKDGTQKNQLVFVPIIENI